MITTVLLILLAVLVISMILDAIPSRNVSTAVLIVLLAILLFWLLGGIGQGRAL